MVSQTNFCAVSQQTVIRKDPLVPYDNANLSWFNTDILAKNQCLLRIFDAFFCKIAFDKFCFEFCLYFSTFWKKLSEKLSKADISPFVQLSTKLSISVEEFHKLLAILGNYRQSYRYRKLQKNYRKFIFIEKNDLSPSPTPRRDIKIFQFRHLWHEVCLIGDVSLRFSIFNVFIIIINNPDSLGLSGICSSSCSWVSSTFCNHFKRSLWSL